MRKINAIVIHCSDNYARQDIGVKELRKMHTATPPQGNGWRDIGYHLVIRRDGTVEAGRPLEQVGAHVGGYNANTIGVCLVGGKGDNGKLAANYTPEQWATLKEVVMDLRRRFPGAEIKGHRD